MTTPDECPRFRKEELQDIRDAIDTVIRNGEFSPYYANPNGGKMVQQFEKVFAHYHGRKYALAVSSGTAALHVALESLWLPKNSKILTTPYTFLATATSILMAEHHPLFGDIDERWLTLSKPNTRRESVDAVIPVHLLGHSCNIGALYNFTKEDIPIIEDCAQSLGTKYDGKLTGTFSELATFSFQETKTITSGGEGGMILIEDDELYRRCLALRSHGSQYMGYPRLSWNYRMTELQAAVGLVEMKYLDEKLEIQKENVKIMLEDLPEGLKHHCAEWCEHSYFILCLMTEDWNRRDRFVSLWKKACKEKGIVEGPGRTISQGYQELLFDKPVLSAYGAHCPSARNVMKKTVWLDIHRWRRWNEGVEQDWELVKKVWKESA